MSKAPCRSWGARLSSSQSALQQAREQLILALDFPSAAAAHGFLAQLSTTVPSELRPVWVKVGLELFLSAGSTLVAQLQDAGFSVFLDLKFHDIPNTVAGAIRSVLPLRPALLTVHALGGPQMLAAAVAAAAESSTRVLAVTVLTSMDAGALHAVGVEGPPQEEVELLARMATTSGIGGFVCSPLEAARLRNVLPNAHLVVPGIRPAGSATGDQQRVSSPADAIRAGASQLVVGRPVTAAADPAAAYLAILEEIASV